MSANSESTGQPAQYRFEQRGDVLVLELEGDWLIAAPAPGSARIVGELQALPAPRIEFDCTRLGAWDSMLVILLLRCRELCRAETLRHLCGIHHEICAEAESAQRDRREECRNGL